MGKSNEEILNENTEWVSDRSFKSLKPNILKAMDEARKDAATDIANKISEDRLKEALSGIGTSFKKELKSESIPVFQKSIDEMSQEAKDRVDKSTADAVGVREILDTYIPKSVREASDDDEIVIDYSDALNAMTEYASSLLTQRDAEVRELKKKMAALEENNKITDDARQFHINELQSLLHKYKALAEAAIENIDTHSAWHGADMGKDENLSYYFVKWEAAFKKYQTLKQQL